MPAKIRVNNQRRDSKEDTHKYRLLSDLMRYIPDVIYFKDTSGRLVMVNDAHARGLGLKPQEVVGKTDFDFFPRERAEMMARDDRYVMRTGKAIIDKIERSTRPDGVDNYVSTTKIPRHDEKGRIIGLIGITRDISRRMQLEHIREEKEAIEKKLEAAEELNRVKSEFVSVVSHELRTPLAIIKEAVMLMADEVAGSLNEKQKEILIKAQSNIKRLKGIIDDLLDVSRIESGRMKLHYSLANLNDLLKEPSDFFRKQAKHKGIDLEYILPKEQVNIFLDPNRLNQVVSNLVYNAIKFTEEDGKIRVELKVFEDRVRLAVIDSGIGIARADLPRLFNKFTQVSRISDTQRKGVGLGLSIAKELVERHGGEIWVESKLGVGSKFYFTLPRLHSLNILDRQVKEKINNLLAKGITLHFVNLLIINYKELKRQMPLEPKKMFKDIEEVINKALARYFRRQQDVRPEIILSDTHYGECCFYLPSVSQKDADSLTGDVLDKLKGYFLGYRMKDVFINAGVMSYPKISHDAADSLDGESFAANLKVRRIFIGPQMRKYRRLSYRLDVEAVLPGSGRFSTATVDISEGGICFYSPRAIPADSLVEVTLKLPGDSGAVSLRGNISWIKEVPGRGGQYKTGLEFIHSDNKVKNTIRRFLRSLAHAKEKLQSEG